MRKGVDSTFIEEKKEMKSKRRKETLALSLGLGRIFYTQEGLIQ
jgi:hypothetical protein